LAAPSCLSVGVYGQLEKRLRPEAFFEKNPAAYLALREATAADARPTSLCGPVAMSARPFSPANSAPVLAHSKSRTAISAGALAAGHSRCAISSATVFISKA